MTQGLAGSSAPGVHSLDHFALAVPDLDEARRFYEAFCLEVRGEGGGLSLYTDATPQPWGRLVKGDRKQLRYLSFAADEDFIPYFAGALAGAEFSPPIGALHVDGLWFNDLNGLPIQIRTGPKKTLDAKHVNAVAGGESGVRNAPLRGEEGQVRPTRLSHILIFVPDVPAAIQFYAKALGLRLSDQSADAVAFMHAVHGCDHHLVAFAKGQGTGLHHSSWDVPSIDHIGRGAMQMRLAGYDRGWGLGRHVLGSNFFHYVRDPWGSYAEYSHDIDYIPKAIDWQSTSPPVENSLYLWGPDTPEDFITNYENT